MEENKSGILTLPDEIVLLILEHTTFADCNSFRLTCKRFNEIFLSSQSFWKAIYRKTVGNVLYKITLMQGEDDWMGALKYYLQLRYKLILMLVELSHKHFVEAYNDLRLIDTQRFFDIALSKSKNNYYLTVSILQDFIKKILMELKTLDAKKPYTLTELHYAKNVVRYLLHTLLCVKWVQNHMNNQLQPHVALNFFIQWVDPGQMHPDEDVSREINQLIKEVDASLQSTRPSKCNGRLPGVNTHTTCPNGIYTEKEVLLAISHVMYKQKRMTAFPSPNLDTLNIIKTIKTHSGHGLTLGAIYQAIARGFGITSCNLIAFANHLYLEWRDSGSPLDKYLIVLDTGELRKGGFCPFSAAPQNPYQCSPDTFIQYVITSFLSNMGDFKHWHTENATRMFDFLSNQRNSEYCDFVTWIRACISNNKLMYVPFNIERVSHEHIDVARNLLTLNKPPQTVLKNLHVKERTGGAVSYSVGMVLYHKKHDFVCVVRDWEFTCPEELRLRPEAAALTYGLGQPFYCVVAIDLHLRYVAQENLAFVSAPNRLDHMEDAIAREFTHFNGFFYEPNVEKQQLYPGDYAVASWYAARINADRSHLRAS